MVSILLLLGGIYALAKKRIKISSKRELTGKPAKLLGIFYIVMAGLMMLGDVIIVGISLGVVFVVTLIVVVKASGQPVGVKSVEQK